MAVTTPINRRISAVHRTLLSPTLGESDAADIIHTMMAPEVYRLIVHERGWPPERYAGWLTKTLIGQLLPGDTSSILTREDRDVTTPPAWDGAAAPVTDPTALALSAGVGEDRGGRSAPERASRRPST